MPKRDMTEIELKLEIAELKLQMAELRAAEMRAAMAENRAPVARKQATEQPAAPSVDFTKVRKLCPHCEKTKFVIPDFGTVNDRGRLRPQGRCRACRSSVNYHTKPRVYEMGQRKSNRR